MNPHQRVMGNVFQGLAAHRPRAPRQLSARGQRQPSISSSAASKTAAAQQPSLRSAASLFETDANGQRRVRWNESGWRYWEWNGNRVHYISAGDSGPPLLLLHGFGASAYHWRYNIPELAERHRVFAVDLVGFGLSDKPVTEYGGAFLWSDQVAEFVKQVVKDKPVLVGNSLGGFVSIATAARHPDLVRGVVGVNAAGFFEDGKKDSEDEQAGVKDGKQMSEFGKWLEGVKKAMEDAVKHVAIMIAFYRAKGRIRRVLNQVYIDKANVDEDLVRSIQLPTEHPNAAAVYSKIVRGGNIQTNVSLNALLAGMSSPMLLLWGDKDPWMTPQKAQKIVDLYPKSEVVMIDAGHCPHDEKPSESNAALLEWMSKLSN